MRILLAVDGSHSSNQARDLVASLPFNGGGYVRIVTVAPTIAELLVVPWPIAASIDVGQLETEVLHAHREALATAEQEIRSARSNIEIHAVLLRGRPASSIVEEAREMDADLVVVGHRGQSRWESALLGSVSAEVVDQAPCPVLVARDDQLGPIVLADDRSLFARAAECALIDWPIFDGLPVTVVTVAEEAYRYAAAIDPLVYTDEMEEAARRMDRERRDEAARECEAAVGRLRHAGMNASAEIREGDPAQEIVAAALAHDAGLIVVGTRGQTGLRRLILGSVARNVLVHAPCSVLVVRGVVHAAATDPQIADDREAVSAFG